MTPRLVDPLRDCAAPARLPGQSTDSPTDGQLFGLGAIETVPPSPGATHIPPARLGERLGDAAVPRPLPAPAAVPYGYPTNGGRSFGGR